MIKPLSLPAALAVVISATAFLGGCASLPPALAGGGYASSANAYNATQAQTAQRVRLGVVVAVRSVSIAATPTQAATGSVVGAALGGLAGHQVGGGNGKKIAAVAGAIAGAIGGNKVTSAVYKQPGLAITVKFDGGDAIEVTQAADVAIHAGQKVQVIGGGYNEPVRVVALD